jgi:hypothetical protein
MSAAMPSWLVHLAAAKEQHAPNERGADVSPEKGTGASRARVVTLSGAISVA